MTLARWIAGGQGAYYLVTGLWALVSLDTFQRVTGPKTDLWLVQTFSLVIVAISLPLLLAAWTRRIGRQTLVLGLGTALAFAAAELVFGLRGTISPIYLADAALELAIAAGWIGVALRGTQALRTPRASRTRGPPSLHDRGVL